MNVKGKHYRTIWIKEDAPDIIQIIDQRYLPHEFIIENIESTDDMSKAIKEMRVRGAGLIGAAAGFGMYLGVLEHKKETSLSALNEKLLFLSNKLKSTRPTAVNLAWAADRVYNKVSSIGDINNRIDAAYKEAQAIADEDASFCENIGRHGVNLIERLSKKNPDRPVNILTHCNAGWLAFVDYGTATAPIYEAHRLGIPVHVWVDETRPLNQGARLTAWELVNEAVPHTVIVDNAGGHLMQHGMVDMVIVGSDRTTVTGDVANKIGTYLKALSAYDNNIPFYAALPSSTIDWNIKEGVRDIPIEQRSEKEVKWINGIDASNARRTVLLTPQSSQCANFAFDVTPSRLVTGIITERGIANANEEAILALFPEKRKR
ncbi:translation initiation factor, aif-2bi family [Candidatus Magnetoovum chiemensis]|nr:translation initiation factor, aif-2bi family [Candidatus Magnetoovum chiemensis]